MYSTSNSIQTYLIVQLNTNCERMNLRNSEPFACLFAVCGDRICICNVLHIENERNEKGNEKREKKNNSN